MKLISNKKWNEYIELKDNFENKVFFMEHSYKAKYNYAMRYVEENHINRIDMINELKDKVVQKEKQHQLILQDKMDTINKLYKEMDYLQSKLKKKRGK